MGRGKRVVPSQLAAKLLEIRERLDLSQEQMFKRLGKTLSRIYSSHISGYEHGIREPPLDILLQYARVAGVPVEVLIDDELDLPDKLPSEPVEWVVVRRERPRASRR
ncbi:MAG: Helix-turn-helix domain [Acidobacteriota bacterium]|jgi:transcriptional regulator with XRE-family HTH domain|nr:Helix-turn-helix domain [Acidobacteriota bacterium]